MSDDIKIIDETADDAEDVKSESPSDEVSTADSGEVVESESKVLTEVTTDKVKDTTRKAIESYQEVGVGAIEKNFMNGNINASQAGKDVAHLTMTAEAMQDTEENKSFRKKFSDIKKDELVESAKKELAEEEARKIAAKQHKAEAFYISYRPILEFDLDHLLVKNSTPRPKYIKVLNKETGKKEKVLAPNQPEVEPATEKPKHTYQDRSYGIPLMVMMLMVLVLPYFLCTVVLSVFNAINYIFVAISRFSKPAFVICAAIASIVLLGLFIYIVILCIEGAFHVDIIPDIIK